MVQREQAERVERDERGVPGGLSADGGRGLRLGEDVRFVLVAVGGGAIRIGQQILRQRIRYLESIAINCDPHVQECDEFDRRIFLGPETGGAGDTGGSSTVGGILARAAQPVLDRVFEGATFVTVIGSLGGGAGTGALPPVIEAAARKSVVLSVFVVKPFSEEHERRALAERALGRLHFLEHFVEKQQRRIANLQVLDNATLAHRTPGLPFNQINHHWAELIGRHIKTAFVLPAEAMVASDRLARVAETEPMNLSLPSLLPHPVPVNPPNGSPPPLPLVPALLMQEMAGMDRSDAELTFEVGPPIPEPPMMLRR